MGKAARRRKDRRREYLEKLSAKNPAYFKAQWERRIDCWLSEIRILARNWAVGEDGPNKRIFEILEEAMIILQKCDVSESYVSETLSLIRHECCSQVSRVVDPRLYRLSNMDRLVYKAKKTARA